MTHMLDYIRVGYGIPLRDTMVFLLRTKNMNKRLFLSTLIVIISIFISSCSGIYQWRFLDKNGNWTIYKKSEYNCFYERTNTDFYIECFSKTDGSMEYFHADQVIDVK